MFSPPNQRYTTGNLTLFQPEEGADSTRDHKQKNVDTSLLPTPTLTCQIKPSELTKNIIYKLTFW